MKSQQKDFIKKELEKIYDNSANSLKNKFVQSLKNNPKLNLMLRLMIVANVGIWSALALLLFQTF